MRKIQSFDFCLQCGNQSLLWDGEKKWSCSACDYILYHNCAAAVAVILRQGSSILFTRRNQNPCKGKLDLPGGFVDPKETAEQTCRRELKEELNLDIHENQLHYLQSLPNIYYYKGVDYNTLDIFFECRIESRNPISLEYNEISEILWIPFSEIPLEDIAFDSQKKFLEKYISFF